MNAHNFGFCFPSGHPGANETDISASCWWQLMLRNKQQTIHWAATCQCNRPGTKAQPALLGSGYVLQSKPPSPQGTAVLFHKCNN